MLDLGLATTSPAVRRRVGAPVAHNELLIGAGQSNEVSYGTSWSAFGQTIPAAVAAIDPARVRIWFGGAFVGYAAGTNSDPTGIFPDCWGPEAQYAVRWLADHPIGTLYIVKRPISDTSLSSWLSGGTNFANLTSWVDAAKAALAGIAHMTVVHFAQGEWDTVEEGGRPQPATANAYRGKLEAFVANARAAWGEPTTKIVLSRVYFDDLPFAGPVRAAQNAVAWGDARVYLTDTDDLTLVDPYHYDAASVVAIGDRGYDAIADGISIEAEP